MNVPGRGLGALAVATATTACFSLLTGTEGLEGTRPAADASVDATPPSPPKLDKKYTEVLGRFVGTPTAPLAGGLTRVDLGVTFPANGKLTTLFGDNAVTFEDSVAFAPLAYPPTGLPELTWLTSGASFVPLRVPSVDLGDRNVPVEGLSVAGKTYVFFATGWDGSAGRYGGLALAHSGGSLATLELDFSVLPSRFVNVSVVQEGGFAWIFGSGSSFRQSPVFLARAPLASLGDRKTWTYFKAGSFVPSESDVSPLVDHPCVGELSVRKHPKSGLWIMAYNCTEPRGILVRTAPSATGPWSAPIVVMDSTSADGGYGRTMHTSRAAANQDDGLSDELARVDKTGSEYGPYLVPEWFDAMSTPQDTFAIVYTMSTVNPYDVWLMRTVLGTPGAVATRETKGVGLPKAKLVNGDFGVSLTPLTGWAVTGTVFAKVSDDPDGKRRLWTNLGGDNATGTLSQDFTVDATTSRLTFWIFGGDASVKLLRGTEVLRQSWGNRSTDVLLKVVWNLEDYRGDKLRLLIEDNLTGPWGWVGVKDFVLE